MEQFEYYKSVLQNYTKFDGRARRSEFWYFALFNFIITVVLGAIGNALDITIISSLYSLAVFIPSIAVGVRRLHDIGKSGWMLLIGLIPIIGVFYLIFLFIQDSENGENQYGLNPKGDNLDITKE